ncbi:hypothetical protein D9758_004531 [Tetrapyrgos nigripes]|uniref:Uncharacterized protein n=1 Tax=Tetrapyrgos nigripes TaxID=182062 RepID=A0A8H5H027_9AGAR|nr:hypothetical protein D9758_004531 [Tetrapyrgos nigripes]
MLPSHNKHSKMVDTVQSDLVDDGGITKGTKVKKRKAKKGKKAKKGSDSSEGSDFQDDGESTDLSEDSVSDIPNEEHAQILTAKTFPPKAKSKPKKKKRHTSEVATVEEVEDEEAPPCHTASLSSATLGGVKRTNPIYLFFEEAKTNAKGEAGEKGDKHFHCIHGSRHVLTMTNSLLNGLRNHLKSNFRSLFNFYEVLKDCDGPITQQEIDITAGCAPLNVKFQATLDVEIEQCQETIKESFSQQQAAAQVRAMGSGQFKDLLVKWIVACDQPFSEVEQQEFIDLMQYVHHSGGALHIPKKDAVCCKVLKLGKKTMKEMKEMFLVLQGKVALSIDAWTLSSQYPFLAVVAHWIADDSVLEECLIDFQELEVWKTLETYGLLGKTYCPRIIAIVMDNTTNNDTMMQSLEEQCHLHLSRSHYTCVNPEVMGPMP